MPLRLNAKQLAELIESIEAGGGDASLLRHELEELAPETKHAPPRRGYRRGYRLEEEEETTEERINRRVGYLFPDGITDELLGRIIKMDGAHSMVELRGMCREHGLSTNGDKKVLAARLIADVLPETKLPQTVVPFPPQTKKERAGRCYELAWKHIIHQGEGTLNHGEVWSSKLDRMIGHAWVETETSFIYEPESDQYFEKNWLYKTYKMKEVDTYTPKQAAIMAARTNYFGPWTKEEQKWIR